MALAQEFFFEPATVAEERDEFYGQPRSSDRVSGPGDDGASSLFDHAEAGTGDVPSSASHRAHPQGEAQLARMVRELRTLEDDIVAKLTAAERLLGQLASRRVHEDAGYLSRAEFEQRVLAPAKLLRTLREAVPPATGSSGKLTVARRETTDTRARQNKALTAVARAFERIRNLDAEIHECATAARAKLSTIEGMRVFEECGYTSFEEFLERALGPSPILANVMTLLPSQPAAAPAAPSRGQPGAGLGESPAGAAGAPGGSFNEPSALLAESPPLFDESPLFGESPARPAEPPALFEDDASGLFPEPSGPAAVTAMADEPSSDGPDQQALSAPPTSPDVARRRNTARIVVCGLLCLAAAVVGAAAGVGSELAVAGSSRAAAPAAVVSPAPSPSVQSSPGVAAHPAAKQTPAPPATVRHSDGR